MLVALFDRSCNKFSGHSKMITMELEFKYIRHSNIDGFYTREKGLVGTKQICVVSAYFNGLFLCLPTWLEAGTI